MFIGRVIGTVVSTRKEPRTEGVRFLLVERLVAMDAVDAGVGEVVLCAAGSAARLTAATDGRPTDAAIIGIVDDVDIGGQAVYRKDSA
jgi:carbon dioxide concentrating mechanism protein CcmL